MKKFIREYFGTRRLFQVLSVFLALCMLLTTVSLQRIMADGPEKVSKETLIPSSVVISEPTALSNISLPQSKYGSLSWENGSAVPDAYEKNYSIVFKSNGSADLSGISGYDAGSGTLKGSVTVVVKSLAPTETPTPEATATPEPTETPTPEVTKEPETPDSDMDDSQEDQSETDSNQSTEEDKEEVGGKEDSTDEEDEVSTGDSQTDTDLKEDSSSDTEEKENSASDADKGEDSSENADKGSDSSDTEQTENEDSQTDSNKEQDGEKETSDKTDSGKEDSNQDNAEETDSKEDSDEQENTESDTGINDITEEDLENAAQEQPETADPEAVPQDQAQAAAENHTCGGISVSADFLPWYVQFRVSSGDSYEFSNEEEASIFQSYEFELWNLLEDKPYEIPEGKYVTVTVPVKEGYEYTIEHLLGDGSSETIIPTVYGSTMIFSVDSFSPFGIAGSKPLVGDEIAEGGYSEDTPTPTPTKAPSTGSSVTRSDSSANSSANSSQSSSSSYTESESSNNNSSSVERTVTYQNKTAQAVQTGDTTAILPFIIMAVVGLVVIAAIIIIILVVHNRRR